MGSFPETFYDLEIENPDNWCPGELALEFNSDRMKISCIFQLPRKFSKNTIFGVWKVRPAKQFFYRLTPWWWYPHWKAYNCIYIVNSIFKTVLLQLTLYIINFIHVEYSHVSTSVLVMSCQWYELLFQTFHVFLTCISYLTKSIQTHRISTNYTLKLGDEVVKVVVRKIIIAMVAVITRLGTLKTKLEFEKSTERCCTVL